ncbi:hypothetical protein BH09BAC1_BH09BAC1_29570 [soil metagenome]
MTDGVLKIEVKLAQGSSPPFFKEGLGVVNTKHKQFGHIHT